MRIKVTNSNKVWQSDDGKYKIWDVTCSNGTVLQTKSEKIAGGALVEGGTEFDVEVYEKNGRSYVRQEPKDNQFNPNVSKEDKQFKADPASRESIEWQTSLKGAIEVARDYYTFNHTEVPSGDNGLEVYAKEVDKVAVHFKNLITLKPTSVTTKTTEAVDDDSVPLSLYDDEGAR